MTEGAALKGEKILITGPTSQVAFPIAAALAAKNDVFGLARLSKDGDVARLEAVGVRPLRVDLAESDLGEVPEDVTLVLNFAVVKSGDFDYDLAANAEGVGRLMARCQRAKAFVHCSSAAVYEHAGHAPRKETDPLGDNHRVMFPTYSIAKIAAETMVRFGARQWNVPSIIARLSVPYGANGGWPWFHLMMMKSGVPIPLHADAPNVYNLLHEDDYLAHLPRLVAAADVPAVTVNWGGEAASIEDWCAYLGELTGLEPKFETTEQAIGSLELDLARMNTLLGPTRVGWRDGIRRLVETRNPELLKR
jgi:nucleoside-diphosphate-sugar epimerase